MTKIFTIQRISRLIAWLCFIGILSILLIYQTILLNDYTPSTVEKLMTWLTSRGVLVLAMGYGYLITPWCTRLVEQRTPVLKAWWTVYTLSMIMLGIGNYLLTGDGSFVNLALAGPLLVSIWSIRGRWAVVVVAVLLLNLPAHVGRWYQANRHFPLPTSEEVNLYEQTQRLLRQEHLAETQYWIESQYLQLANHHARVWPQQLLNELQTGRWSSLIAMVLLGMIFRRYRAMMLLVVQNALVGVTALCALTTLLDLTSGRAYATTLRLYFDSQRYPGYYVFDAPDALFLTVTEASCVSTAVLVGTALWLLSNRLVALRLPLRSKLLLRRL